MLASEFATVSRIEPPTDGGNGVVVLALSNDGADANPGWFGPWAEERGLRFDLRLRERSGEWPDLDGYDLVVSFGSAHSIRDDEDGSREREIALVGQAVRTGVPVMGICYGAHLMSVALGAPPKEGPEPEIGWVELDVWPDGPVGAGPWMVVHHDLLTVPLGATLVARTDIGPQAHVWRNSIAVQFHPEADPSKMNELIDRDEEYLRDVGLDVPALRAETSERAPQAREQAFALFDWFLARPRG